MNMNSENDCNRLLSFSCSVGDEVMVDVGDALGHNGDIIVFVPSLH